MKSKLSREKAAKQLRTSGDRRYLNTGSTSRKRARKKFKARKKIRKHHSTDADDYREELLYEMGTEHYCHSKSDYYNLLYEEYERVKEKSK